MRVSGFANFIGKRRRIWLYSMTFVDVETDYIKFPQLCGGS